MDLAADVPVADSDQPLIGVCCFGLVVVPIGENDCLLLGGQWFSEAVDCTHNVEPVIETTEEESHPNRRKSLPRVVWAAWSRRTAL